jgi:hypothetical protein
VQGNGNFDLSGGLLLARVRLCTGKHQFKDGRYASQIAPTRATHSFHQFDACPCPSITNNTQFGSGYLQNPDPIAPGDPPIALLRVEEDQGSLSCQKAYDDLELRPRSCRLSGTAARGELFGRPE